jgi:hypothetical protein
MVRGRWSECIVGLLYAAVGCTPSKAPSDAGSAPVENARTVQDGGVGRGPGSSDAPESARAWADPLEVPFSVRSWERPGEYANDDARRNDGRLHFALRDVLGGVARTETSVLGCARLNLVASLALLEESATPSVGQHPRARLRLHLVFTGEGGFRRTAELFAEVSLSAETSGVGVARASPWRGAAGENGAVTLVRSTRRSAGCDFVVGAVALEHRGP